MAKSVCFGRQERVAMTVLYSGCCLAGHTEDPSSASLQSCGLPIASEQQIRQRSDSESKDSL